MEDDLLERLGAPTCARCGAATDRKTVSLQNITGIARNITGIMNVVGVSSSELDSIFGHSLEGIEKPLEKLAQVDDRCPKCLEDESKTCNNKE